MFPDLFRDDVFRLETRRLWLQWPRAADVDAILRGAGEKAVAEMTSRISHPLSRPEIEQFVLGARSGNAAGRQLTLAVTERGKPGCVIGMVGIELDGSDLGLGYWIAPSLWGHGYATEAARAMIDAFFAYAGGRALVASARTINPASRRVLEKCGFASCGSGLKAFPARGGELPVDHLRLERRSWERGRIDGRDGGPSRPKPSESVRP